MARPTTGSLPTMTMVIGVEDFRRIDGPMGSFKLAGEFGSFPLGTRLLSSFSSIPSCPGIAAYLSPRESRLDGCTAVNSIRILSTGITVLLGGEPAHLPGGTYFVVTGDMPLGRGGCTTPEKRVYVSLFLTATRPILVARPAGQIALSSGDRTLVHETP